VADEEGGKTDEIAGRASEREDDVSMVSCSATGFDDGVEGHVSR
jgi:hypothetical protein